MKILQCIFKIMQQIIFAFLVLTMIYASASAEQQVIEADGSYTIGDGLDENISVAKDRAKAEALRNAGEQACVYVDSLTIVQEGMLTKDEIKVISSNIMQVQGEPKYKIIPVSDDVIRYQCHVTVLVDTDNINAALLQDKASLADAVQRNKELEGEVERLNREMEELKQKYIQASTDTERQEIRQEAKRNEEGFIAAQWNEKGAILYGECHYAEAIDAFNKAIEKNPGFAYAYHNRGTAYGKLKEYGSAISDFSRAIALDGTYATAYGGRGFAYYGLGDYEHAAADFSKAIVLKPSYAEAYYGRGNVYMNFQHYEEAMRDYEKALALNPQLDAAKANRDMILNAMK